MRRLGVSHLKIKAEGKRWQEALAEARTALGDARDDRRGRQRELGPRRGNRAPARDGAVPRGLGGAAAAPRAGARDPELAGSSAIPLMADESLTTVEEARQLVRQGGYRLFNLRVSKLGGVAATHRIARIGEETACGYRWAARSASRRCSRPPADCSRRPCPNSKLSRARSGTWLLENDVTDDPYEFGQGGDAVVQMTPGLGVTVAPERFAKLAINSAIIS